MHTSLEEHLGQSVQLSEAEATKAGQPIAQREEGEEQIKQRLLILLTKWHKFYLLKQQRALRQSEVIHFVFSEITSSTLWRS
jgi:hypothetical protein